MAVGNGDERPAATWERMEGKLDRLGERFERLEGKVDRLGDRVDRLSDTVDQHSGSFARLESFAERAERRMMRLETDVAVTKLLIEAVRHETDNKIDRLKEELLTGLGREMRIELLAAQTLNDGRLAAVEHRVDALEASKA